MKNLQYLVRKCVRNSTNNLRELLDRKTGTGETMHEVLTIIDSWDKTDEEKEKFLSNFLELEDNAASYDETINDYDMCDLFVHGFCSREELAQILEAYSGTDVEEMNSILESKAETAFFKNHPELNP